MSESTTLRIAKLVENLSNLSEGYLDPEQEFGLRIDTLGSMMDTARSIAADLYAFSKSYNDELGSYAEVIETIQDLLVDTDEQICAIAEDLEERYGEDKEDEYADDDEDDEEDSSEEEY